MILLVMRLLEGISVSQLDVDTDLNFRVMMIEPRVFLSLSGLCVLLRIYFLVVFRDITSDPLRVDKDTWRAQSWQFSTLSNSLMFSTFHLHSGEGPEVIIIMKIADIC